MTEGTTIPARPLSVPVGRLGAFTESGCKAVGHMGGGCPVTEQQVIAKLQDFVNGMVKDKAVPRVLEAGCGSSSHLRFEKEVFMVGIDISEKQLQRNSRLNERILGDIQYYDFQPSSFDVIVCWDVLEHLRKPELSLQRFASAARENGIVVLKAPNVCSLKGLVTKCVPYAFHVLSYRYFHASKKTAQVEMTPFKTYLKFSAAPAALRKYAAAYGLRVVYFDTYDVLTANWLERKKTAHAVYKMLRKFCELLSFGKLNDSEFVIVLQKAATAS